LSETEREELNRLRKDKAELAMNPSFAKIQAIRS
jgi:hypothetical protein